MAKYDPKEVYALARAAKLGKEIRAAKECPKCGGENGSHYPWCGNSQN